jgi:hypothetical protein
MHLLPDSLVERLKNRQAILVTGLGCAELAGMPGWLSLCERMAEWIEDESAKRAFLDLVGRGHITTAVALLRDLVAADALVEVLLDAYPAAAEIPECIRTTARAPWRGIVNTGFDALWSNALSGADCKPDRIVSAAGTATLEPGRGRFLVQLFGRADVPDSLCLAPVELGQKVVAPGAGDLLLGLHNKWSFVYVGFNPDAPDLAMLASRLLGASKSTLEHYLVCPGLSDLGARQVRAELGLVPVPLAGTLEDALTAMAQACTLAGDKPPVDDVEAWLERLTAEPADEEARAMVEQGLAVLQDNHEWSGRSRP